MLLFQRNRRNGFALVITLILISFGTIILLASGLQLSRTTGVVSSYQRISSVQNVAGNVVEIASCLFLDNFASFGEDDYEEWGEAVEFTNMLASRSSLESLYWSDFLDFITEDTVGFNMTSPVTSYSDDSGLGEGKYNLSAHVYPIDDVTNRYVVVASAELSGTKRFSIGLISTRRSLQEGLPGLRTVSIDRVLALLRNISKGKGTKNIVGDIVFGDAIVAGTIYLNKSLSNTLEDIIAGVLSASGVVVYDENGNQISDEEKLSEFLGELFTGIEEAPNLLYSQWVHEYLDSLPEAVGATVTLIPNNGGLEFEYEPSPIAIACEGNICFLSDYSDELTISVSGSDEFQAEFTTEGLTITSGASEFSIPSSIASDTTVHIVINGDTTFVSSQEHKISIVDGKYDIRVNGDVTIDTQFVYDVEGLVQAVNNGKGKSLVSNKTAIDAETTIDIILGLLEDQNDSYLRLAAYGGDMSLGYSSATHGDKNLMGDFFVIKNDEGKGGQFLLGDLMTVPNLANPGQGQFAQLFLLGSITTWFFDNPTYITKHGEEIDLLNSLAIVATGDSGSSGNGSSTGNDGELALLGIQTW